METAHPSYQASRLRPPRPTRGTIPRPRIDGLLELVRARALTIVKAPPGYGKTSAAQSWAELLAGDGARVAWLSLSAQDDDEEGFFNALAAAVQASRRPAHAAAPGAGTAGEGPVLPPFSVRELSIPLRHRSDWLLSGLASDPGEFFLVLDDYHEITQPAIHHALSVQMRHAPEHLHLILLSRSDPPIDLAPLRAHDAVLEIDAQTLRFDLAETQLLLRKCPSGALEAKDAPLLHELTDGWVAALRAALLGARIQGYGTPYLKRLPGALRSINALFAGLLEQLPTELLHFMEHCSVAERLCAPLARRLSGREQAQALLEQIERQQLFIEALDERRQWFGFHRLFREGLQRSLQQRDPACLPALRREAAAWCAEQGLWTDAIEHALAAGETAQALAWIEHHAMAVVGAGDLLTLLGWEKQLRAHLVESPLRLRLAFAWGLGLAMACDKALVLLDGVESQVPLAPAHEQAALRRECLALRAVVVCTVGDHEGAAALVEQCGSDANEPPWVSNALRVVTAAVSLHSGRWSQLYAGRVALPSGSDLTAQAYRLSIRGLAELRQGHLDEAASLLQQAMDESSPGSALAAMPAPTLALVRYLQDRTAEAARLNTEHLEVNKRVAPIEGLYAAYLVAARLARLDGQPMQARHLLDEGESIGAARGWRRVQVVLGQEKVRLCLLDGRLAEADASARRLEELAAATRSRLDRIDFGRAALLARAWCDLAGGRPVPAAQALQSLQFEAHKDGRRLDRIGLLGALALAQQAGGEAAAATRTLLEACQFAEETGALRALLDQPVPLAPLLPMLLRARHELAAQPRLEPLLKRLQRAESDAGPSRAAPNSLDTLSPRERHILNLLAEGQSNKSIARALGIAPETVKTHVSKIFGKLGAQNRAQAAAMVTHA